MTEQADAFPPVEEKDCLHTSSVVFVFDTGSYTFLVSLKLDTFLLREDCLIVSSYVYTLYRDSVHDVIPASAQKKGNLSGLQKVERVKNRVLCGNKLCIHFYLLRSHLYTFLAMQKSHVLTDLKLRIHQLFLKVYPVYIPTV